MRQLAFQQVLSLPSALERSQVALQSDQQPDGYWWYTLEANESIGAGVIWLMHFFGDVDPAVQAGLVARILTEQRPDGSWPLFYDGPPDLSATTECYFALRLAGYDPGHPALQKARTVILKLGGIGAVRVFTKIHLALFGLAPWSESPAMPVWLMKMPLWSGLSIYEFSSWARASIVPLLVVLDRKPVVPVEFGLDELKASPTGPPRRTRLTPFFLFDSLLKKLNRLPFHPGKKSALRACERWIREHIARTEDIYPAMAYGAMAIKALGFPNDDPTIQKALGGLKRFRQSSPATAHQQCCISPLWDTPWVCRALLESGIPADDPSLLKAARYLIGKQIREIRGDWAMKNPGVPPGGWAFEFQNDYFPDVDDTIEILRFLREVELPPQEKEEAIGRGLRWLLSMQSRNGGWAAFDKDNLSGWVNSIPFSDHGACLDPPSPDITGRAIELLAYFGHAQSAVVRLGGRFLPALQEPFGPVAGR